MINRYKYSKEGYFFKKNFLNKNEKKKLFNLLIKSSSKFIDTKGIKNFESLDLHNRLLDLRKNNPKNFGLLYDSLNLNFQLRSIFYSEKMQSIFSNMLNVDKSSIFINGFMFRMDAPRDQRNSLDWHQDSRYYQMTFPDYNSGVCWIALTSNTKQNGTLNFVPYSHVEGLVDIKYKKKSKLTSEQYKLPVTNIGDNYTAEKWGEKDAITFKKADNFNLKCSSALFNKLVDYSKAELVDITMVATDKGVTYRVAPSMSKWDKPVHDEGVTSKPYG